MGRKVTCLRRNFNLEKGGVQWKGKKYSQECKEEAVGIVAGRGCYISVAA